jgi:hypothetical protein
MLLLRTSLRRPWNSLKIIREADFCFPLVVIEQILLIVKKGSLSNTRIHDIELGDEIDHLFACCQEEVIGYSIFLIITLFLVTL